MTSSAPLLSLMMREGKQFFKCASGPNKFVSVLDRMNMKLHSKLGSFLRVKTKILETLTLKGL